MMEVIILKKSKKLLSLFLAALMLMSCFGAIGASAMTMDEAEQAAQEFNANIPDHSGVYANKSAKEWNSTMKSLDTALSTVLKAADLKAKIYCDGTASMLLTSLGGLLYGALEDLAASQSGLIPMLIKTVLKNLTPAKVGEAMEKEGVYPEIAAYLKSVSSYDEIDSAKLVWGITPGDRTAFVNAAGYALFPVGYAINFLSILNGLYPNVLVPIIEGLGQGAMPDEKSFKAVINNESTAKGMHVIINPVCDAIDDLLAAPLSYACGILPGMANALNGALETLRNMDLIGDFMKDFLPESFSGLLPMVTDALGLNLTLPEIDEQYLITMGSASAAESGREDGYTMQIKGDSTMVFAAVAQYLQEVLQDQNNQVEIGRFIVDKLDDQTGHDYADNYMEIVNAAISGTPLDVADACLSLIEEVSADLGGGEDVNPVIAFFAKIAAFFSTLAKKIIALFK